MYRICKKCNRLYWYDVPVCLTCKQNTEIKIPLAFEVIGKTVVNLKSRNHKKTPYQIIALKDEFGYTQVRKTFKHYKIGDKIQTTRIKNSNFILCSKIQYIKQASSRKILNLAKDYLRNLGRIALHINLDNCEIKDKYEIALMPPKILVEELISKLEKIVPEFCVDENDTNDALKAKYKLTNFRKNDFKKICLVTYDNFVKLEKYEHDLYFIDAEFITKPNTRYHTNLYFLTDSPSKLRKFLEKQEVSEEIFFGEEMEVIKEELEYRV